MTFLLPEMRVDCWPSFPRITLTVGVTRVPAHTVSYKHGFVFTRVYYGLCGRYFVIWVFLCLVLVSIYRFLVSPSVAFSSVSLCTFRKIKLYSHLPRLFPFSSCFESCVYFYYKLFLDRKIVTSSHIFLLNNTHLLGM